MNLFSHPTLIKSDIMDAKDLKTFLISQRIEGVNLSGTYSNNLRFSRVSRLKFLRLDSCHINRFKLDQSSLKNFTMSSTWLNNCELTGTQFTDSNFKGSFFYETIFKESSFININFEETDITASSIENSYFFNCNFMNSTIISTTATACYFGSCNFINCDLSNLTNLDYTSFEGSKYDNRTKFPETFKPEQKGFILVNNIFDFAKQYYY
jgi:uncharacterized protein YjbI with pentapeptide repeats